MQTEQKKKAVIYCRVSTKEQVEEGNSLSTQEKTCRDYALKNGYDTAEVFIEQGESAKTAQRTELQRLLSYCSIRKNGISAVIAYKLDRISRNTDDYSQIRLLLKRYGVEIKSTSEFFENTPAGRFMENIIANVAQFDNDVRTERSVGGMREAVREGRYVWLAPIGYRNAKVGGKSTIAQSEFAPLIAKAFKEVAANAKPIEHVRISMAKEGLVNPNKKKPLAKGYFYKLLSNELYAGWICKFGERHQGAFEPIVPEELFAQVQRVLKHRTHRVLQYRHENPDFPLRRFVQHPSGKKLSGGWCQGNKKKYPYYWFALKGMTFKKEVLDELFVRYLNQYRLSDEQAEMLQEKVQKHLRKSSEMSRQEAGRLKKRIDDLKEKQEALLEKNLDGVISDTILKDQLRRIDAELTSINGMAIHTAEPMPEKITNGDFIRLFLKAPGEVWRLATFEQQRLLQLFNFPQGVFFDGKKFRTIETSFIFNVKEEIDHSISSIVPHHSTTQNNAEVADDISVIKIANEMKEVSEILENEVVRSPQF